MVARTGSVAPPFRNRKIAQHPGCSCIGASAMPLDPGSSVTLVAAGAPNPTPTLGGGVRRQDPRNIGDVAVSSRVGGSNIGEVAEIL
ncbi:hypothetical protein, partial [Micromonospora hortensis]|uniref:hypothetical protein n=1 Tax=Micromonospora hortensis TaxID=2911209 RepID=UPI001EE94817